MQPNATGWREPCEHGVYHEQVLARRDAMNPKLAIETHQIIVRAMPLLSGEWFHESRCHCGNATHGTVPTYEEVRLIAPRTLACWPESWKVTHQEIRSIRRAARLVAQHSNEPIVHSPFGRANLSVQGRPVDVAVDASFRPDLGIIGIAAVTGAGWVQLGRLTGADDFTSADAEFMAMAAGLELVPEGTKGVLYSDDLGLVTQLNRLVARRFRMPGDSRIREWLSQATFDRLRHTMRTRSMTIRWARRNSTWQLTLADQLAGHCSKQQFDDDAVNTLLAWQRGEGFSERQPNYIELIEYPCSTTDGRFLYSA